MAKVDRLSHLTEDDLVEAALEFANVRFRYLRHKSSARRITKKVRRVHLLLPYRSLPINRPEIESNESIRAAHAWLCGALPLVVRKRKDLAPAAAAKVMAMFTERAVKWLADVELRPYVDQQHEPKRHVVVRSVGGLCAYAVALIVERGYFIRRCKPPTDGVDLTPCKNIFWARKKPGRYLEHCPQHRKIRKPVK